MSSTVEAAIDVNAPLSRAYNQWTQFEDFPRFMQGVHEVRQLDDTHLHWRAEVGGREKEWDAEIVQQIPDHQISWRSTSGAAHDGVVTFATQEDGTTRVAVRIEYDPEGWVESIGDALGFMTDRVQGDLRRFKEFLERRGSESGAWRGEVRGGTVQD